jgi:ATP-dependent helicase HrpB
LPKDRFSEITETRIDPQTSRVVARRVVMLGAIEVRASEADPPPEETARILTQALAPMLPELIDASPAAHRLRRRIALLRAAEGDGSALPDLGDDALVQDAPLLLAGWLEGLRSLQAVRGLDWHAIVAARLDHAARTRVDAALPTHWTTPAGTRHAIDYSADPPVLAVRLQEMFGASQGPVLAGGRVPCVLHLLSPAHRPAAITSDLASFWKTGWLATKKDLKGRYPRHFWPDDPASAMATAKVRPRPA